MKGDTRHTYLFKTADGWARRVLASTPDMAAIILAEEIVVAEAACFHAYRDHGGTLTESRLLNRFKLSDFTSVEIEH